MSKHRKPAPVTPPPSSRFSIKAILIVVGTIEAVVMLAIWVLRPQPFTIAASPDRNVLLVTVDTLRADALGSYGGHAVTPNLDALAAHGARFEFAHSHAVVTLVSHASILTGRYPYEHGIRDNTGYRLPESIPTAATLLKARGFDTGAFVGGFPLDRRFGLAHGFDAYDDHLTVPADEDSGERERRADAVVSAALDWISARQQKWFAWVHVYDPHAPYAPPGEWASRFAANPYLGEVSWTDSALGALFDRIRQSQQRPTLVIVTGDHGESLGEHGELTHSIFAYESTLHVPLIVSEFPAQGRKWRARGKTISTPVRHVDLLPTLLDAVGAPPDAGLPGASLRPLIDAGRGPDRPSYFEAMSPAIARGWAPLRGVLVGREKYIDLPMTELYDLAADPQEKANLAARQGDRVRVLMNTLRQFNVAPPSRASAETPETIERLRSLGYIGGGTATVREQYTDADDPKRLIALEQLLQQAADAARSGRPDDAAALYRKVISERPDTEDAYRKLALLYWRQRRPGDAVNTLEAALRAGVTQTEVRIKLAQYLAESGQPDKAIALMERDAGDDPDALVALGNAYIMSGRTGDALKTFRHLLAVDPASALAHQNIGTAQLQARDFAAAEVSLRKAVEIDPKLSGAWTALGVALASSNRRADAIDAWKRAVALDGSDFNALFNLTVNLAHEGRREEARIYGVRFIQTAPPDLQQDIETIRRLVGGS
jgi:arylsulfatase A-like enzyme/Flp pilus assembly protein TadD